MAGDVGDEIMGGRDHLPHRIASDAPLGGGRAVHEVSKKR
jgi:hypothetical protein